MKSRAVVSIVSCLTLCAAAAVAQTMEVRSYDLQHADMPEVVDLVQDLLSDEGSVTVRPRSSQLHVQDRSEFISVVDQFIKDIDQPPEPFRLIVELVEASMDPLMGETEYEPIHGVKRMFRYDHYRLVGAAAVEGKLGEDYLVSLGNDFQVQFGTSQVVIPGGFFHHRVRPRPTPSDFSGNTNQPIDIEDLPGPPRIMRDRLQLDPLRLARVRSRSANLTREVEVFRTKITLKNGQQAILGAGASESSRSVMVFVVRYEVVGAK